MAVVNDDRGKVLMDRIRAETDRIIETSDRRVRVASAELRENARFQAAVSVAGGVLVVIFVGLVGWSVLRYTRDLLRARGEVEALNRELEDRVAARTTDLVRANEEIQRFAYIVSHDLRAPLVNVMGFTSELEEGLSVVGRYFAAPPRERAGALKDEAESAVKQEMPEALDFIRSSTRKMDGLINAILKISREGGRVLSPEEVDLGPLVERQAQALGHQFDAMGATFEARGRLPTIISDRLALEQVFGNLIDNAVKYLDPSRPGQVAVTARDLGSRVEIAVEDNGRGISPQDFDRIFELFRRSGSQDRPGEGIGLAHVRALVRRLGGEISVESRLNHGTCFRVMLPKTMSTAAAESIHA
jgi:signal transduction histidine kinase